MQPKSTQIDEALPVSAAARILGVHPQTLRNYEAQGLISSFRTIGGQRRFLRGDVEAFRDAAQDVPVAAPGSRGAA
jgi:putative resolvase